MSASCILRHWKILQTVYYLKKQGFPLCEIILTTSMSGLGGTNRHRPPRAAAQDGAGTTSSLLLRTGLWPEKRKHRASVGEPVDFYQGGLRATSKAPLPTPGCCAANNPTSSTAKWRALFQPAPLPPKSFRRKPNHLPLARFGRGNLPKIAKLFDKLGVYIIGNCKHEREKLIRHGFPVSRIILRLQRTPPNFISENQECAVLGFTFPFGRSSAPCI